MMQQMKRAFLWCLTFFRSTVSAFDSADIPHAIFFLGIILLGYGAARFHDGLGFVVAGALLVIYVKPLRGWWG